MGGQERSEFQGWAGDRQARAEFMGSATEVRRELELLFRSRAPAVGLMAWDEGRALRLIRELARTLTPAREVFVWSSAQGLRREGQPVLGIPAPCTMREVFAVAADWQAPAVFVCLDADLSEGETARQVRDLVTHIGSQPRSLLFVAPRLTLHPTLRRSVTLLSLLPPDREELKGILKAVAARCVSVAGVEVQLEGDAPDRLADAASGLLADEAERAFIRALLQAQRLSVQELGIVLSEKRRILAQDPLLEVFEPEDRLEQLCGFETLRGWLERRAMCFGAAAAQALLPAPRGMLLVGMTGCGRSAVIRAAAGSWQLPLVRLTGASALAGGGHGEALLHETLERVTALAPCVLWIPSLDHFFAPGSEADGGKVTSPVADLLLRWLLEKQAPVFVAATADEYERLPLSLIWKHAFDEVFFLDFPNSEERRQLLGVILVRRGLVPAEMNLEMLVAASEGFSGVQIEQAVVRGQRDAFEHGRTIKMVDILQSFRLMTPLAGFMGDARRKLRSWAHRRAIPATPSREA